MSRSMPLAPERDRPIIIGFDVVRFVAATMVMCMQLGTSTWADPWGVTKRIVDGKVALPELFAGTWFGRLGLEIFFVISGLVIAYSADGVDRGFYRESIRALLRRILLWIAALPMWNQMKLHTRGA